VALFGEWLRIAPRELRGDTLVLRADSVARGLWPWRPDSLARISRWELRFGAREPATARADWRQGHDDGGDIGCILGRVADCRGLPMLCVIAAGEAACEKFHYAAPDSLYFSNGLRYVRVRRSATDESGPSTGR